MQNDRRHIPIAASQEQLLQIRGDQMVDRANRRRDEILSFNIKYGEELGNFSFAYRKHLKPGNQLGKNSIPIKVIRPMFAKALADAISAQPEESRAAWLTEFLTDLDQLS